MNHDVQLFAKVVESSAYSCPQEITGTDRERVKEKVTQLLNQHMTSVYLHCCSQKLEDGHRMDILKHF